VDEENGGMRAFSGGKARVDELIGVLAIRKAQIGFGRFLAEDGFALHAEQYRTAHPQIFMDERFEQAKRPARSWDGRVYWGGRPLECEGAEDCAGGL
jgi:hypothetical protein